MSASIKFDLSSKLYLKDPDETELGRKIIQESIKLIDEIGFETFNFKKLAKVINSTEASVYRYFENKYKLLIYLVSCYWVWLDYQIDFHTNNISEPTEKLRIIFKLLADLHTTNSSFTPINEAALHRIAICEATKAYMTKEVENGNKEAYFAAFKSLCEKIVKLILEINPHHPYPYALAATLFESAHQQMFFSKFIPSLTELTAGNAQWGTIVHFLEHLAFSSINQKFKNPDV